MQGCPNEAHCQPRLAGDQLGFRRIDWVRVTCDGGQRSCQVVGVVHRRPVVQTVSLRTALDLAARGVPIVIRGDRSVPVPATMAAG